MVTVAQRISGFLVVVALSVAMVTITSMLPWLLHPSPVAMVTASPLPWLLHPRAGFGSPKPVVPVAMVTPWLTFPVAMVTMAVPVATVIFTHRVPVAMVTETLLCHGSSSFTRHHGNHDPVIPVTMATKEPPPQVMDAPLPW